MYVSSNQAVLYFSKIYKKRLKVFHYRETIYVRGDRYPFLMGILHDWKTTMCIENSHGTTSENQHSKQKPMRDIPDINHNGVYQTEGASPVLAKKCNLVAWPNLQNSFGVPTPTTQLLSLDHRATGAKSIH